MTFLHLLFLLVAASLLIGAADHETNPCAVAREIGRKGVDVFDENPKKGLAALFQARKQCPSDVNIAFNVGLGHYLAGDLAKAYDTWKVVHEKDPTHLKAHANLAWVLFEMGKDVDAYKLALEGLEKYPGNFSLAHTKLFSLFRKGGKDDYLKAFDWLARAGLTGFRAEQWRAQAAGYVVEELWRRYRAGHRKDALERAVIQLAKEYPEQESFLRAKDQLIQAEVDHPDGVIPFSQPLPHEVWPSAGNVDDRSAVLDDFIHTLPPTADWKKRDDAFVLLVGINRYKRVRARHFADRDARNMYRLLTSRGPFRRDPDHARLRIDEAATGDTLRQDLNWLIRQGHINPNAMLLFYFSGLGVSWLSDNGGAVTDALLVPVGARLDAINPETAISLKKLKQALAPLPNPEIAIILDTCFNGTAGCALSNQGETLAPDPSFFQDRHTWVVGAVEEEVCLYGPGWQGGLTYFMMKGMLGPADGEGGQPADGWVNLKEAFDYARRNLSVFKPAPDPFLSSPSTMRLTRTGGER